VNRSPYIAAVAVMLAIVTGVGVYLGLGARPNLGLDLQGGISAIYTPVLAEGEEEPEDFEEIIDQAIEVIRARVDSLGVAEPDISRSGTDIVVQLPGVDDIERVEQLIGTTAQLTFRPVYDTIPPGDPRYDADPDDEVFDETREIIAASELTYLGDLERGDEIELFHVNPDCTLEPGAEPDVDLEEHLPNNEMGILCAGEGDEGAPDLDTGEVRPIKYVVGTAALTGDRIDDAFASFGQTGAIETVLELDSEGGAAFAAITAELACERDRGFPGGGRFAITLDNLVESAPTMGQGVNCGTGIRDGTATITPGQGDRDEQEQQAQDLALILRTGALPITLEQGNFELVSPTLGAESLRSGLIAGLIGLALVGVWLIWFYRSLGVLAMIELGVFGMLVIGMITLLGNVGFALTLAGVAGLIVAIGITADSSIIFFERIRDEVNLGKTVRTAVRKAYTSAFRTNLAGNTVTLAAAAILYALAVGPVRGFALMLGLATLLDLLILVAFTRPVVFLMSTTKLLTRRTVRAAERPAEQPARTAGARV
jgi:preprotein translocase subunit SecD